MPHCFRGFQGNKATGEGMGKEVVKSVKEGGVKGLVEPRKGPLSHAFPSSPSSLPKAGHLQVPR